MTRESEKSKIRMSVIVDGKHINSLKKADEVIDQIFDEHEAQLKAKENDLERQDMIIKCLSMDLDSKEKLLKAKNEEIERLKEIINTSIEEEIEYAIIRPQYVEVYLNNAIRFLKEQQ